METSCEVRDFSTITPKDIVHSNVEQGKGVCVTATLKERNETVFFKGTCASAWANEKMYEDAKKNLFLKEIQILYEANRKGIENVVEIISMIEGTTTPDFNSETCYPFAPGRQGIGMITRHYPGNLKTFLDKCLNSVPPVDIRLQEKLHILVEIIKGVKDLHVYGIVHGDLKLSNILIDDKKRIVRLCDFGLSRIKAPSASLSEATTTATYAGTKDYSSPEMLARADGKSSRVSSYSDIFAFGIIACQLLLGHHPFKDRNLPFNDLTTIYRGCVEDRSGLKIKAIFESLKFPVDLDPRVKQLIFSCLDFDYSKRPTAMACLNTLAQVFDECARNQFDLFLSHSTMDKGLLIQVRLLAMKLGYRVWFDQEHMGHDLNSSIRNGINKSEIFIACLDRNYISSGWCRNELDEAKQANKPIVVLLLEKDGDWLPEEIRISCRLKTHLYVDLSEIKKKYEWRKFDFQDADLENDFQVEEKLQSLWNNLKPFFRILSNDQACFPRVFQTNYLTGHEDNLGKLLSAICNKTEERFPSAPESERLKIIAKLKGYIHSQNGATANQMKHFRNIFDYSCCILNSIFQELRVLEEEGTIFSGQLLFSKSVEIDGSWEGGYGEIVGNYFIFNADLYSNVQFLHIPELEDIRLNSSEGANVIEVGPCLIRADNPAAAEMWFQRLRLIRSRVDLIDLIFNCASLLLFHTEHQKMNHPTDTQSLSQSFTSTDSILKDALAKGLELIDLIESSLSSAELFSLLLKTIFNDIQHYQYFSPLFIKVPSLIKSLKIFVLEENRNLSEIQYKAIFQFLVFLYQKYYPFETKLIESDLSFLTFYCSLILYKLETTHIRIYEEYIFDRQSIDVENLYCFLTRKLLPTLFDAFIVSLFSVIFEIREIDGLVIDLFLKKFYQWNDNQLMCFLNSHFKIICETFPNNVIELLYEKVFPIIISNRQLQPHILAVLETNNYQEMKYLALYIHDLLSNEFNQNQKQILMKKILFDECGYFKKLEKLKSQHQIKNNMIDLKEIYSVYKVILISMEECQLNFAVHDFEKFSSWLFQSLIFHFHQDLQLMDDVSHYLAKFPLPLSLKQSILTQFSFELELYCILKKYETNIPRLLIMSQLTCSFCNYFHSIYFDYDLVRRKEGINNFIEMVFISFLRFEGNEDMILAISKVLYHLCKDITESKEKSFRLNNDISFSPLRAANVRSLLETYTKTPSENGKVIRVKLLGAIRNCSYEYLLLSCRQDIDDFIRELSSPETNLEILVELILFMRNLLIYHPTTEPLKKLHTDYAKTVSSELRNLLFAKQNELVIVHLICNSSQVMLYYLFKDSENQNWESLFSNPHIYKSLLQGKLCNCLIKLLSEATVPMAKAHIKDIISKFAMYRNYVDSTNHEIMSLVASHDTVKYELDLVHSLNLYIDFEANSLTIRNHPTMNIADINFVNAPLLDEYKTNEEFPSTLGERLSLECTNGDVIDIQLQSTNKRDLVQKLIMIVSSFRREINDTALLFDSLLDVLSCSVAEADFERVCESCGFKDLFLIWFSSIPFGRDRNYDPKLIDSVCNKLFKKCVGINFVLLQCFKRAINCSPINFERCNNMIDALLLFPLSASQRMVLLIALKKYNRIISTIISKNSLQLASKLLTSLITLAIDEGNEGLKFLQKRKFPDLLVQLLKAEDFGIINNLIMGEELVFIGSNLFPDRGICYAIIEALGQLLREGKRETTTIDRQFLSLHNFSNLENRSKKKFLGGKSSLKLYNTIIQSETEAGFLKISGYLIYCLVDMASKSNNLSNILMDDVFFDWLSAVAKTERDIQKKIFILSQIQYVTMCIPQKNKAKAMIDQISANITEFVFFRSSIERTKGLNNDPQEYEIRCSVTVKIFGNFQPPIIFEWSVWKTYPALNSFHIQLESVFKQAMSKVKFPPRYYFARETEEFVKKRRLELREWWTKVFEVSPIIHLTPEMKSFFNLNDDTSLGFWKGLIHLNRKRNSSSH